MTKTMVIIAIALGAVLFVGVILSLIAPKKIVVTCTQRINASKRQVYDQLRYMKNFPGWSPFLVQDPEQQFVVSGNDGAVGATFSWEGVKEKSKGAQRVVALTENEQVVVECDITVPFQLNPSYSYQLRGNDGDVEVIQQFEVEMAAPFHVISFLMGVKGQIAQTNQQGLALLKEVAEKQAALAVSVQ